MHVMAASSMLGMHSKVLKPSQAEEIRRTFFFFGLKARSVNIVGLIELQILPQRSSYFTEC
jgi:hypothetical protein